MINKLGFKNQAAASVERGRSLETVYRTKGRFVLEHFRSGKKIGQYELKNGVTNGGIDNILDVHFNSGTQITTWYIGLINASGYSAVAAGDTMASHAGWAEFTGYSEANRVTWSPDAPSSQQISNSTTSDFNINATGTLKGAFLVSNNTKAGTAGVLWATALFASDIPVTSGDLIKITYITAGS